MKGERKEQNGRPLDEFYRECSNSSSPVSQRVRQQSVSETLSSIHFHANEF